VDDDCGNSNMRLEEEEEATAVFMISFVNTSKGLLSGKIALTFSLTVCFIFEYPSPFNIFAINFSILSL
jgi:hypothetical protein